MVLPLEGLWWAEDWAAFVARDKAAWSWRMMIRQPDWLPRELLTQAISDAAAKGAFAAALVPQRELEEGRCVQTCTWAATTTRGRCWPGSTRSTSRSAVWFRTASTTRST